MTEQKLKNRSNPESIFFNLDANEELKEKVLNVLNTLPAREREVIKMRNGIDSPFCTLQEIGKRFNITRERVRQIEAKALRRLRHPVRARRLIQYVKPADINNT